VAGHQDAGRSFQSRIVRISGVGLNFRSFCPNLDISQAEAPREGPRPTGGSRCGVGSLLGALTRDLSLLTFVFNLEYD
jgi:hypothetical protein